MSDFVPRVLDNLSHAVVANKVQSLADVVSLNWADEAGVTGPCSNHGWYAGDGTADDNVPRHRRLADEEEFSVIIGSDICYEHDHPALLEGVLKRRLGPRGRVFFLYAVRFPNLHGEMLERLRSLCSNVSTQALDSTEGSFAVDIIEEGCTQHSNTYPGGIQLVCASRS